MIEFYFHRKGAKDAEIKFFFHLLVKGQQMKTISLRQKIFKHLVFIKTYILYKITWLYIKPKLPLAE